MELGLDRVYVARRITGDLKREDNVDVSHLRLDPQASKLVVSQIIIDEVPVTDAEGAGVSAQCSVTASHLATVYIF